MSVIFSNCMECEHLIYKASTKEFSCKAFPAGIPGSYMFRKKQDENEECNNGIKFSREK